MVGEFRRRDVDRSTDSKVQEEARKTGSPEAGDSLLALLAKYIGIGWLVAICIAGATMLGLWVDGRLSTKPIFTIVGLILGLVAAVFSLARVLGSGANK